MARGKKTGGRDIQKGEVLNPHGAGTHSKVLHDVKKFTNEQIKEVMETLLFGKMEDLNRTLRNQDATVMRVWMARIIETAILAGDVKPLEVILNRVLGKPKETVELQERTAHQQLMSIIQAKFSCEDEEKQNIIEAETVTTIATITRDESSDV